MSELKITSHKKIWIAWTNTDLTEGRGSVIPKAICETEATAIRLGKKGSVQGSDCHVTESIAVLVNGNWLYPGELNYATDEDKRKQKLIDESRAVVDKAKSLGLTESDLKALLRQSD